MTGHIRVYDRLRVVCRAGCVVSEEKPWINPNTDTKRNRKAYIMKRRTFLSSMAGMALAASSGANPLLKQHDISWEPDEALKSKGLRISDGLEILRDGEKSNIAPVLREEILDNPDAVFIIRAGITNERDENGIWKPCDESMGRFGRRVAELVFRKGNERGGRTFVKPNMVGHYNPDNPTLLNGWCVHPRLTTGFLAGLADMGNTNTAIGVRGGLRHDTMMTMGITDIFNEHGVLCIEAHEQYFKDYKRSEIQWFENPDAVVEKGIPIYKPTYLDGTTFINMAHAHTHQLGHTTLTLKNIQGVMPRGYGHVCDSWTALDLWRAPYMKHFNAAYRKPIEQLYIRHANENYRHWDEGGFNRSFFQSGGYDAFMRELDIYHRSKGDDRRAALRRMNVIAEPRVFWVEMWAQRMMDIIEGLPAPYVNMVDGVFARGDDCGVMHTDFFTVGRSMTAVDAVTSWIMGHNPRALPYLRIAKERGIGDNDIERIPVFSLDESGVKRIDHSNLERFRLGVYQYGMKEGGARFF